jgi:hypothetical protein
MSVSVELLRPDLEPGRGVRQARGDPDPQSRGADAAIQNVSHVENARDHREVFPLTGRAERRHPRGHADSGPHERVHDLLGHPLAQVLLVLRGAHVGERQDGDRNGRRRAAGRRVERGKQVARTRKAVSRILLETAAYDGGDPLRQVGADPADGRRRVAQDRGRELGRGTSFERPSAARHLVEDDPEREEVRPRVERAARDLFGRHVRDGPHHGARLREPGRRGRVLAPGQARVGPFREAEVEELHAPARREPHVRRLEVAVDDSLLVRRRERLGDLPRVGADLFERQRAGGDSPREVIPLDELHHEKVARRGRGRWDFFE